MVYMRNILSNETRGMVDILRAFSGRAHMIVVTFMQGHSVQNPTHSVSAQGLIADLDSNLHSIPKDT